MTLKVVPILRIVRCTILIVRVVGMPWSNTGATLYHAQLELPKNGRVIKGLIVFSGWDLEPLYLLISPSPDCYQLTIALLMLIIAIVSNTK